MSKELVAQDFLDDPAALGAELEQAGALQFSVRASGLFAASDIVDADLARTTGMDMAWFRDSAHVANALRVRGAGDDEEKARGVGEAFLRILHNNETLLDEAIRDPDAPRLPVRVRADTLENDTEQRVQNDSTAYSIWLPAQLMLSGVMPARHDYLHIMEKVVEYLQAGEYWQQADEGQWEEDRQIHASSIGVVIAGLTAAVQVFEQNGYRLKVDIDALIKRGASRFHEIISDHGETPPDLRTGYEGRKYDASHLFLVESLRLFDGRMEPAGQLVERVEDNLVRTVGVIRYPGDTYYAPGFTQLLKPGERTSQAEGRLEMRNEFLGRNALNTQSEAQWTLFDSLLSAYWGRRYEMTHKVEDRYRQLHYLNRMLDQYIPVAGGLRVPELLYRDTPDAEWAPNDHIPLIWPQGNTLLALKQFEKTT